MKRMTVRSMMQQVGYAVEIDKASQVVRQIAEYQRHAALAGRALPRKQGGNGRRIDRCQIRQIDFRLPAFDRTQPRIQSGFGIIDCKR